MILFLEAHNSINSVDTLPPDNISHKAFLDISKSIRLLADLTALITVDTYLLTPWSRVLLEKLTGFAATQEIPRIYGTRKFITVLTSARHLSLS
jgi:hypothetical protein